MKLYSGWRSSASWRVRWALALKRVACEHVWLDIETGENRAALAALAPRAALPTLVLDDGRVLLESVAIIEWLEETVPEPALLPADPFLRARVRELVEIVNAGIHPLQNTQVRKDVSPDPAAQAAWSRRWIERGLLEYEARVAETAGRFSAGDRFGMADLFLAPQVRNAERHGADLAACPRVRAIHAACMGLPEARATAPLSRPPARGA